MNAVLERPAQALRVLFAAPSGEEVSADVQYSAGSIIAVVGVAHSETDAMRMYLQLRPDVIVLDWRLSVDEPARLIGLLTRLVPDALVVALVPAHDSEPARAAHALCADLVVTGVELPEVLADMAAGAKSIARSTKFSAAAA